MGGFICRSWSFERQPFKVLVSSIAEFLIRPTEVQISPADPERNQCEIDLTANALSKDPQVARFSGRVSDSGEGRWTVKAAIDEAVPVPVLSSALYQRFSSRGEGDFADKLLSAMRYEFGGHSEKPAGTDQAA